MPVSPVSATTDLASFAIKANDAEVQTKYQIISIEVEHALNRIPSAQIVVRDGSAADESFTVAAGADFAPGAKIKILTGYHQKNTAVFSGVVVKTAIQHRQGGDSTLTVHCRDTAAAMTVGRRSACYTDTTDGDVMKTLITRHKLSADVTATSARLEEITQFAATDWDFLMTRAEANGFVVAVADNKVSVKAPALSGEAVLAITYGVDLLDVDLEEDARTQSASVACTAWDPKTQKVLKATQAIGSDNPLGTDDGTTLAAVTGSEAFELSTTTPVTSADLTAWAKAQVLKFTLAKIRGTVRFQGSALIAPGKLIELAGLGERFDGKAYVSGVRHELRAGNWTTEATIGLDPAWFAAQADVTVPSARNLLPGAQGLHLGTVKQIHQDPGGEIRVLVVVPVVDATGKGIWARYAQPYAGKQSGMFFYPETDDEVVIAFLDSDPRFPIVLGSVYSSGRQSEFTPDEKNTHKAIVTKAQLKVIFDDEKKIFTIITPHKNTIEISDDQKSITITDEHSNSAKFSSDGITLTSASDITLTAKKNITLDASMGIAATAKQNVTVQGLDVVLTAQKEFKASANLNASLTASVQTVIKGAMVMIN
jgi:Rhs element Vgr protein